MTNKRVPSVHVLYWALAHIILYDGCPFHSEPQKAVFVIMAVYRHSQGVQVVKNPTTNTGDVRNVDVIRGREDALEEDKATHSSVLAWRILWTEEPGELQSIE